MRHRGPSVISASQEHRGTQLSIRNRLLAAFGLMIFLLLTVAGAGGFGVSTAHRDLDRMDTEVQPC